MDDDIVKTKTIEEAKKYLTFINPNSFEDYHKMVAPRSGNHFLIYKFLDFNYTYISKYSVLFPAENPNKRKNNKKNTNPQKLNLSELFSINAPNSKYNTQEISERCSDFNMANKDHFIMKNKNNKKNNSKKLNSLIISSSSSNVSSSVFKLGSSGSSSNKNYFHENFLFRNNKNNKNNYYDDITKLANLNDFNNPELLKIENSKEFNNANDPLVQNDMDISLNTSAIKKAQVDSNEEIKTKANNKTKINKKNNLKYVINNDGKSKSRSTSYRKGSNINLKDIPINENNINENNQVKSGLSKSQKTLPPGMLYARKTSIIRNPEMIKIQEIKFLNESKKVTKDNNNNNNSIFNNSCAANNMIINDNDNDNDNDNYNNTINPSDYSNSFNTTSQIEQEGYSSPCTNTDYNLQHIAKSILTNDLNLNSNITTIIGNNSFDSYSNFNNKNNIDNNDITNIDFFNAKDKNINFNKQINQLNRECNNQFLALKETEGKAGAGDKNPEKIRISLTNKLSQKTNCSNYLSSLDKQQNSNKNALNSKDSSEIKIRLKRRRSDTPSKADLSISQRETSQNNKKMARHSNESEIMEIEEETKDNSNNNELVEIKSNLNENKNLNYLNCQQGDKIGFINYNSESTISNRNFNFEYLKKYDHYPSNRYIYNYSYNIYNLDIKIEKNTDIRYLTVMSSDSNISICNRNFLTKNQKKMNITKQSIKPSNSKNTKEKKKSVFDTDIDNLESNELNPNTSNIANQENNKKSDFRRVSKSNSKQGEIVSNASNISNRFAKEMQINKHQEPLTCLSDCKLLMNNDKSDNNNKNNTNNPCESFESVFFNSKGLEIQPDDSNSKCFICEWEYPQEISSDEKNAHVNFCLEGQGERHKANFLTSMKLILLATQSSKENKKKSKKKNSLNNNTKDCFVDNNFCPLCSRTIVLKYGKTMDSHLLQCYSQQEQQQFLYAKALKRK